MNKYENMLRTIDVNKNNEKLTDAEFRQFVRNTLSGIPFSSETSAEKLEAEYRRKTYGDQNGND